MSVDNYPFLKHVCDKAHITADINPIVTAIEQKVRDHMDDGEDVLTHWQYKETIQFVCRVFEHFCCHRGTFTEYGVPITYSKALSLGTWFTKKRACKRLRENIYRGLNHSLIQTSPVSTIQQGIMCRMYCRHLAMCGLTCGLERVLSTIQYSAPVCAIRCQPNATRYHKKMVRCYESITYKISKNVDLKSRFRDPILFTTHERLPEQFEKRFCEFMIRNGGRNAIPSALQSTYSS